MILKLYIRLIFMNDFLNVKTLKSMKCCKSTFIIWQTPVTRATYIQPFLFLFYFIFLSDMCLTQLCSCGLRAPQWQLGTADLLIGDVLVVKTSPSCQYGALEQGLKPTTAQLYI